MSCPTCDHTMQGLAMGWFWCPRCGTVRLRNNDRMEDSVPYGAIRLRKWLELQQPISPTQFRIALEQSFLLPHERSEQAR